MARSFHGALIAFLGMSLVQCGGALRVVKNELQDSAGNPVRLRGVSHSGTEYGCVQGLSIIEGTMDETAIAQIKSWGNNVVRVPLNEDCWLGINGAGCSAAEYQEAIKGLVDTIISGDLYAILDLHWTAPDGDLATAQQAMPDASHAITLWAEVAAMFNYTTDVVLELFNEPFPGALFPASRPLRLHACG